MKVSKSLHTPHNQTYLIPDRLAHARYLTARYHQNPTRRAPFNSAQLNWLRERIPTYMRYHPKSDETRHFIRSTVIEFDILWPFRQKLWPGSTAETPFTDDMHATLLALSWIVQTVSLHVIVISRKTCSHRSRISPATCCGRHAISSVVRRTKQE